MFEKLSRCVLTAHEQKEVLYTNLTTEHCTTEISESSGPCIAMYLLKVQHSCLGTSCDSSHNSRSGEKLVAVAHLYTLIA